MHTLFTFLFRADAHPEQKARFLVCILAIVLMLGVTATQELQQIQRPLQVGELAGRQVSMDKLADVFLGMDQLTVQSHFYRMWTYNGVIFLGALLVLRALRDSTKK